MPSWSSAIPGWAASAVIGRDRVILGEPRQEDLLTYLVDRVSPERLEGLRDLLQIDLRPAETAD